MKSLAESNLKYEDILTSAGFHVNCVSPLQFKYVNASSLLDALNRPNDHSGIIFTSPRAVEAIHQQYSNLNVGLHSAWLDKKIFSVGETTANLIKEKLKFDAIGSHTGNAQQLAAFIIDEIPAFDKPLLFPCGNLKKENLPMLLAKQDRDFRALTCYETSCDPHLKTNVKSLVEDFGVADVLVFFSPSGVEYTIPILTGLGLNMCDMKFIALGPSTNAALVTANLPVAGVCASPAPDKLLHVLKAL